MLYQLDDFSYDSTNGIVFKNGGKFELSNIQNKLLDYLIQNTKTVLSKQTLMDNVWERIVSENSVDQIILALRGVLENDPTSPTLIVTHFGKGISFEASVTNVDNKPKSLVKYGLVVLSLLVIFLAGYYFQNKPSVLKKTDTVKNNLDINQKLLILPTTFDENTANSIEQQGMNALLSSNFSSLDSQQQIIFDNVSLSSQQAIEKH